MSTATVHRSPILDSHGKPFAQNVPQKHIAGRYDSAQTSSENIRHWSMADALSADAANSPAARKTLRERARYEVANNGWARAMVDTLAHETIGTGPRVQVLTGNTQADEWIERGFLQWCQRIKLARKFRTMRKAKAQDGEGIGMFVTNAGLGDVQLDIRLLETEQLATPNPGFFVNQIDGIDVDTNGNPVRYHVLKNHPGDVGYMGLVDEEITPAPGPAEVLHLYREDRPGQHRGVPELTPALPIFSRLRRFTLATLAAAENVADITLALRTRIPETGDFNYGPSGTSTAEPSSYEMFDTFDMERGLVTVLPDNTDLYQPDPKQPGATHSEFVKTLLAEAFAAVCMPYAVGAADSSDENFASGKLTRLGFKRAIEIERRTDWDPEVLKVFWAWFSEAKFSLPSEVRRSVYDPSLWLVDVHWDGVEDIDPEKAARARSEMLSTGQISFPAMFGERGVDWQKEQERQAEALGLSIDDYRRRLADKLLGPEVTQDAAPQNSSK